MITTVLPVNLSLALGARAYGKSQLGNGYDYYGKIIEETARFLQQVVADTLRKFCEPHSNLD